MECRAYCLRQARRLYQFRVQIRGSNSRRIFEPSRRTFAAKAYVIERPGTARTFLPGSFAKVRFSPLEVPPLAFWQASPEVAGLQPEEFFQATHTYVDLAVADEPRWPKTMSDPPHSLSYSTLHYAAMMMMNGPPGPAYHIALHIYHTLSMLNYVPSILTLTRLAWSRKMLGQPQFHVAEQKFAAIIRRRDDPNACTLQGLILAAQFYERPHYTRVATEALQWFRQAAALGGEEPWAWDWQASCALEMGKLYSALGETDKARAIWRYCAEKLDIAEGCWEYAKALESSDDERREWVKRAAVSGVPDAAREMARLEFESSRSSAAEAGGTWEKRASEVFAREWQAIAGSSST